MKRSRIPALLAALLGLAAVFTGGVRALTPPAGTLIINRCVANAYDLNGNALAAVSASATTPISAGPRLSVRLSETPAIVLPGNNFTYTLDVLNTGNGAASGVTASLYLPPEVSTSSLVIGGGGVFDPATRTITWNIPSLPGGETAQFTVTALALSTVANGTLFVSSAAVSSPGGYYASDISSATAGSGSLLSLALSGPASVTPGGLITYNVSYYNNGNAPAAFTRVTAPLPPLTSYSTGSATSGGYASAGNIVWDLGSIPAGSSGTVTYAAYVSTLAAAGVYIFNTVSVISQDSSASSPQLSTVVSDPAVVFTSTAAPAQAAPGGRITITLDFTNDPAAALYGLTLTALLPEKTTFASADNGGVYSAGQTVWSLGNLLAGESRTVRLSVDAAAWLSNGDTIISSASASATGMPVKFSYSTVSIATSAYVGSILFTDQAFSQVSVYRPGDTLYIEMTSPSANLNSGAVDTATVTVTCAATGDSEIVTLTETAAGSGIFRGSLASLSGTSAAGNGALGLTSDASVRVTRYDASAPGGSIFSEALIDPYGVVFNSVTGAPVGGAVVTIMDSATGNPAVLGVGQQNPFTTDSAGRFYFPFVPAGSYYLSVAPGAGYSYPTVLAAASVAPGFNVSTGSKAELFTFTQTSPVLLDIPVDPGAAAFSVAKTCDRSEAYTGDILYCSVSVTNIGGSPASALRLVDLLPHGFAYAKGTSLFDGARLPDPVLSGANRAVWTIESPAPGASRTVRYAMLLGADSEKSDGTNRAYAEGSTLGAAFVSNTSVFRVKTGGGVFTSRGTLIGRVFIDANADGLFEEGETGVEGAEVYTEDGVRAKTDRLGKYHINSALPGSRVVRLDTALLPPGLEPEAINHRFAEDGVSQFVDMDKGGLRKANFALLRSSSYYSGACAAPAAAPAEAAADENYEALLSSGPRDLAIIAPADGAALDSRRASAAVKFPSGSALKLYVNGEEVPGKKIGRRLLSLGNSAELYEFIGLELGKGPNTIKAETYDAFGNKRGEALVTVTTPGDAAGVEIRLPAAIPAADGRSVFSAEALLIDESGKGLGYSGLLTAEISAGSFSGEDADRSAPGFQVLFEKGRALIALRAPEEQGPAVLKVTYNDAASGTAKFSYKPFLRDMLVTGLADLRLGRSSAGGASGRLKKVSFIEKGTYSNGRGAFFAKGRLWKEISLTASYDTAKETDRALFRQDEASPDSEARYPLYGDESALNRETYSSDKLFIRASRRDTSLLWGDYWTALQDTRLAQHQRSLTGARLVSAAGPLKFTAFAAKTDYTRAVKAQRGKGTSGFYYLDILPMVAGSERVVIETRDRQYPDRVLSRRLLALNSDYTADYELGAVLFKEPVPSVDMDFNPVYVVVSYESSGGARQNSVYGGRAAVTAGFLSVGLTGAVEENQAGDFRLSGADAALKLPQGTTLKGEAAATRSLLDEGGVYAPRTGSAWTASAETSPLNLFTLTAVRTHSGRYFNNISSLESRRGNDRFETGLRVPLGGAVTLRGKYSEDRDTLNGGAVLTRAAGLEKKGKKYSGSLDLEDEESTKRYIPANLPGTRAPFDFSEAAQGRRTSAKAKVKTALGRLGLSGEYSQDVRSGLYTTAQAGAEYKLAASKLYLRQVYDRNHDTRETRSLAGIETALSGELTAVDEYRLKDGASGSALQQSMGLRNRHSFSKTLTGTASLEHLKTLSGNKRLADPDAFAVSGGLEYLPHEKLKLSGRAEYRTSDIADSWLGEFNSAFTLGSGWALLNQNRLVYEDRLGGEIRRSGRYSLGFSYRPEDTDTFNALLKTEYRDTRNTGPAQGGNLGAFIFSGEGVYQPSRALQLTGRYAGKFSKDGGFSAYTDLAAIKAFYDIGRRWDVGGEYRRLLSRNGGGQVSGGFAETGYLLGKDLWLSGGWSFDKFDADLAGDGYWGRGAYLRLRIKFDDTLFRKSDKDSDGDGVKDQLDKCPGAPACGEVDAQGCPPPAPAAAAPEPAAEQPVPELPPSKPAPLIEDSDADGIPDAADTCPASAPCAVVDSSGCACPYQEPVLNLDINFPSGKATITDEYQDKIHEAAELLEHNPDISLEIEGHTDDKGRPEKNLALSAHRAENVRDTLIERYGADASRIKATGYGDTRPLDSNATAEGSRRNRRVVAVVHSKYRATAEAGKCPSRPEAEKDARGCPVPVKSAGVESVKLDIVFETDRAEIMAEYDHEVEALAVLLRKDPTAIAEVEGHTDNLGASWFNRELSEKRAQAVADMLVNKYGIEQSRLEVRGYGDSRPIADNATREGRQKNRRVIVIITHQKE